MAAAAYAPGEIGSLLSGKSKKAKSTGTDAGVLALFSGSSAASKAAPAKAPSKRRAKKEPEGSGGDEEAAAEADSSGEGSARPKEGKAKKKKKASSEQPASEEEAESEGGGAGGEEAAAAKEGAEEAARESKRNARKRREEEEAEKNGRTVFVGNLAVSVGRKELARMFAAYGTVESVRLRSIVAAKEKMPQKVAFITGSYGADTCNAYVVFSEEAEAEAAQAHNGTLIAGKRIRVDLAGGKKDHSKSVFVGNLPLDSKDDEVFAFFEQKLGKGTVDKVRLVRDKTTHKGKGFGFVSFVASTTVPAALKLHATEYGGRALRVFKALPEEKAAAVKAVRSRGVSGASTRGVLQSKERARGREEKPWQGARAAKTIDKKRDKKKKKNPVPRKPPGKAGKDKKAAKLRKAGY